MFYITVNERPQEKGQKMTSQKNDLWTALKNGRKITRAVAWYEFGISELPKRISELRQEGKPINDVWIKVTNRNGKKTRVKEYSADLEALEREAVA